MLQYQNIKKDVLIGDLAAILDGRDLFIATVLNLSPLSISVKKKATLHADGQFDGFTNLDHSMYTASPLSFANSPKLYFIREKV